MLTSLRGTSRDPTPRQRRSASHPGRPGDRSGRRRGLGELFGAARTPCRGTATSEPDASARRAARRRTVRAGEHGGRCFCRCRTSGRRCRGTVLRALRLSARSGNGSQSNSSARVTFAGRSWRSTSSRQRPENAAIPQDFDYAAIHVFSREAREKLLRSARRLEWPAEFPASPLPTSRSSGSSFTKRRRHRPGEPRRAARPATPPACLRPSATGWFGTGG